MNRILVVDDAAINLRMAEYILRKHAYEVETADNGRDAIECLKRGTIDLVLLDIEMPGMNGFDTYKEIRALGIEVPVMFLSASEDKEIIQKALDMGAVDYIKKPFEPKRIQEQIGKIL